ncbi:MAG: hypothetical protein IRZ07_00665 [Microbispora sp.]|nr:hypothetical protein [Microbispora sp.]
MSAANDDKFVDAPKTITASDRWQALVLAKMNEERAELCAKDQGPLRVLFEMNAKFLMRVAE